jgi:hypothetical protein
MTVTVVTRKGDKIVDIDDNDGITNKPGYRVALYDLHLNAVCCPPSP